MIFSLCLFCQESVESAEFLEPTTSIQTKSNQKSYVSINCNVNNAQVFINGIYQGLSPIKIYDLVPGFYFVQIRKNGFKTKNLQIFVRQNVNTEYFVELEQAFGFIKINNLLPNAIVKINGNEFSKDLIRLPVGAYQVFVCAFGYDDFSKTVLVTENAQTQINPVYNQAKFEIKDFSVSRKIINPLTKTSISKTDVSFFVTAPGFAEILVKNDENSKGTISLWQNVREFLDKEFPDAAMISEWGEPDKSILGGFHMDFLLHFGPSHYNDLFRCEQPYFSSRGKGTAFEFIKKYKENYEKSDKKGLICIPSGNHDMDRLARHLSVEEMKVAFAFLLTMPGAPFIYYGDEIGMRYVENLISVEGGYGRTGSRSPMQWDNSTNAGFSLAPKEKLYVPQDESQDRPTVENQIKDENSLWKEVQKLIKIRQENKTLQNLAEIEFLSDGSSYPLVYQRIEKSTQEKITVILNPSEKECSYKIEDGQIICSNSSKAKIDEKDGKIFVPAISYAIVKNQ